MSLPIFALTLLWRPTKRREGATRKKGEQQNSVHNLLTNLPLAPLSYNSTHHIVQDTCSCPTLFSTMSPLILFLLDPPPALSSPLVTAPYPNIRYFPHLAMTSTPMNVEGRGIRSEQIPGVLGAGWERMLTWTSRGTTAASTRMLGKQSQVPEPRGARAVDGVAPRPSKTRRYPTLHAKPLHNARQGSF